MDIATTNHIDNSRVAEKVYVLEDSTSIFPDPLLKSNALILIANTPNPYVVISNIVNEVTESNNTLRFTL